ncbi:MAG TPA: amidase [Jiangellaceae bacterium]|nr:amidase [Jiangellaceae bacterium]
MAELHDLTALELAAAVRRREVSPAEVVDHSLDRAERIGGQVGAFTTLTPELAREQAQAAERALTAEDDLPPLLGVPCPIKDLAAVAGIRFTAGSAVFTNRVAPVDDGVVTLLREAGTVMIGKTSTPEFGLPCYTEPDIGSPARTPWDPRRSAGGSSGGGAAAVAAGIAPVAHGSDGGGSIRIPASACGLVGLKASRGRVSPGPHGVDGPALAMNGALTTDVRDTAALLDVLSAPWPGDTYLLPPPQTTFLDACARDPGRLRIGVLTTPVIVEHAVVDQACLDAVAATAALLADLGHRVDIAPTPFPPDRWEAFEAVWAVLALGVEVPPDDEERLVPLTRWLRDKGRAVSGLEYAQAVAAVQAVTRETARAWERFDVILSPTLARLPALVGDLRRDDDPAADFQGQCEFTPWTSVWNLTGCPAISLPLHRADVDGTTLPVGVMLGGRLGADERLLSLAAQLEAAQPWRGARPAVG